MTGLLLASFQSRVDGTTSLGLIWHFSCIPFYLRRAVEVSILDAILEERHGLFGLSKLLFVTCRAGVWRLTHVVQVALPFLLLLPIGATHHLLD